MKCNTCYNGRSTMHFSTNWGGTGTQRWSKTDNIFTEKHATDPGLLLTYEGHALSDLSNAQFK